MRRVAIALLAVLVGGALGAGMANATGGDTPKNPTAVPAAVGELSANAPGVRVAAAIDGNASTGSFAVLYSKGVQTVTNPVGGVYCVKIDPSVNIPAGANLVAAITVDWNHSPGNDSSAQWGQLHANCPGSRWIEVHTFNSDQHGGSPFPDNAVAFSLIVP